MPTYQYECDHCGHSFEVFQSMLDKKFKKCPTCKKMKLHRLIGSGSGIIFKGNGFYETDYKKSEASDSSAVSDTSAASASGASSKKTSSQKSTKTSQAN